MAVFIVLVGGVFWASYRGTVMGSRSVLFGGRDLEPVTGAVAFALSDHSGGDATLHVVDTAGGAARSLAAGLDGQSAPSWSPDRTRVAYASGPGRVLHTVGGAGESTELTAVTDDDTQDREPAWSPDGAHVAFLSDARDGVPIASVFVVPAAGGPPRHIGPDVRRYEDCFPVLNERDRCWAAPTGDAEQLAWLSSDELVYAATVQQDYDPAAPYSYEAVHGLYRVGLDGTPAQLVAEIEHHIDQLVPSPDGRFVLYGQVHGTTYIRELASGQTWDIGQLADPTWSPDGTRLLFKHWSSLYSSAPDGSDRVNLTHSHFGESFDDVTPLSAAWSPDGRHIAFSAGSPSGDQRLFVANADGTGWTEVFETDSDIAGLHWLPWQP